MSLTTSEEQSDGAEVKEENINGQPPAAAPDQTVQSVTVQKPITLQPAPLLLSDTNDLEAVTTLQTLPFVDELPASVRDTLPSLKFAGHTYSASPNNRMIIINNSIKREGDPIEQGLKLEEITWDGVILNSRGVRFQVMTTTH
jgi:general secretion pathway protein B